MIPETYNTPSGDARDQQLWEIAKARASFKYHLATYVIINIFLWILWYMSGRHESQNGLPWAIWPTLGWGIGLLFHYLGAYVFPRGNLVEKEYQKLKQQQSKINI